MYFNLFTPVRTLSYPDRQAEHLPTSITGLSGAWDEHFSQQPAATLQLQPPPPQTSNTQHSPVNFTEIVFFCVKLHQKRGWHQFLSKPLLSFVDVIFFAFLAELDHSMHIPGLALLTHSK